jgi:hypothetical protein
MQSPLKHFESCRRLSWCALVILLAVCSLTVSVTTRYCKSISPINEARSVQKHIAPEVARQRLTRTAANWMPPVVSAAVFEAPSAYPRIAPAAPPIPNLLFDKKLYNRPPPSAAFFA